MTKIIPVLCFLILSATSAFAENITNANAYAAPGPGYTGYPLTVHGGIVLNHPTNNYSIVTSQYGQFLAFTGDGGWALMNVDDSGLSVDAVGIMHISPLRGLFIYDLGPGVMEIKSNWEVTARPGLTTNVTITACQTITLCFTNGILRGVQ